MTPLEEHIQQVKESSIARVWIKPGKGNVLINGRQRKTIIFPLNLTDYYLINLLVLTNRKTEVDIICTVKGGGLSGQAGAIRHGISRALVNYEPELRKNLKEGFLTRDSSI